MFPLPDGISRRLRVLCPQAFINMTTHPESDCRIGHDAEHVRPFAHMTTTLKALKGSPDEQCPPLKIRPGCSNPFSTEAAIICQDAWMLGGALEIQTKQK